MIAEKRKLCVCGMCVYVQICTSVHICVAFSLHFSCGIFILLLKPSSVLASLILCILHSLRVDHLSLEAMKNGSRVHFIKTM